MNEAIAACSAADGGRVVVPTGVSERGPIRLKSRVNLYLSDGAVLKFSTDPKKYLPLVFTRWEGTELMKNQRNGSEPNNHSLMTLSLRL